MAKIEVFDTVFEGFSKVSEKMDFIGSEIYSNVNVADFRNYLLDETKNVELIASEYQRVFADAYNPAKSRKDDRYGDVYDGYTRIKEAIIKIQEEIYENLESSDFKKYILDELGRLQVLLLEYQRVFVEGYCYDTFERKESSSILQQRIDAMNEELERKGPSL